MSAICVAVGVIVNDFGEVLIARRPQHKHQGGLWEFPGGKVEPGESTNSALSRELAEELGIFVQGARPLLQISHAYIDKQVLLDVWLVDHFSGEPSGLEGQSIRWVPVHSLWQYPFPAANRPILRVIALPELAVVTGNFINPADFETRLRRAADRGAGLVYLRLTEDSGSNEALLECVRALHSELALPICAAPPWAERLGGGIGLHLPAVALSSAPQRDYLDYPLVGASCHNQWELDQACSLGLDYAFLSPLRATQSHPGRMPLGLKEFDYLAAQVDIPVYALGGLGPADLQVVKQHGAHGLAALSAFWN